MGGCSCHYLCARRVVGNFDAGLSDASKVEDISAGRTPEDLKISEILVSRSGNHVEANKFVVDTIKALTPRLGDSQSNLKPLAASALAEVAASVTLDSAIKVQPFVVEEDLALWLLS